MLTRRFFEAAILRMPATSNKACTSTFGPIALVTGLPEYIGLWGNYPKTYKPQTGYMPRFAQASLTISPAKQGAQVMMHDIRRVHVSKWHTTKELYTYDLYYIDT